MVISSLENVDWHSFLARAPLSISSRETIRSIARHPVLITGAGGSIGSSLARRLANHGARVILLDASETNLHDLQREFADAGTDISAAFHLGSAADHGLLNEIFAIHSPRFVFHAAAFKHVPLLEEQPLAAITNNVFATEALVGVASENRARVVLLSTDKAVAPASVMGATKRVAEQIVLASSGTVVRLGNVLATRGSVTEVFARQIAAGLPLTVTDPAAQRYFLTIAEAVDLLLAAAAHANTPALFAPQLQRTHFVADLARFMVKTLSPGSEIPVEFTRLRAGDKECEELWSAIESPQLAHASGLVPVSSPVLPLLRLQILLASLRSAVEKRDLTVAISILRDLVPDYMPSPTLLSLRSAVEPPVHHE